MGVGPGGVANVPLMGGGRLMWELRWTERSHTTEEGAGDRTRPALPPEEAGASPAAWGSDMGDTHSWQCESRLDHRPASCGCGTLDKSPPTGLCYKGRELNSTLESPSVIWGHAGLETYGAVKTDNYCFRFSGR